MQSSFFFTVVQGQGLKTYDATFPVFLKFVLSQGWKAGGQTSLKISLFTRPGVWKPRALDFDIKPDYHHCRWWIAESKVLPICFSHHSGGKKRVAPASGFRTGAPDPYYKICLKTRLICSHYTNMCICIFCVYVCTVYIYMHTYRYRYIYEYISIMQHLQWSHAVSCSHPQGLKTYDATFPVFFKFVVSQGWKPGGPTFSKISLLTRPGVWKPRDWDFDKKSHYHHCTGWIPEPKVLPKPLRW